MQQRKLTIIRSNRKSLSLQIRADGSLLARAPLPMPESEIMAFVREKSDWIEKHLEKVESANRAGAEAPLSMEDIHNLAEWALAELPPRVHFFAERMGVTYGRITIRNQRGRWGSCSSAGNLNFNCLLMLAPGEVQDYVIVHELAHRKQMNHSAAFWKEVEQVLPDYRRQVKWLKEQGPQLLARMNAGAE